MDLRVDHSTQKQRILLRDLWIHISASIPSQRVETAWANLTIREARDLIRDYYTKLEHFDAYEGPEEGTPEYDALSAKGKAFIYEGCDPLLRHRPDVKGRTMIHQPVSIAPAECPTCDAWVRWTRTGTGNYARQELHEDRCTVHPRMQRNDAAHAAGMST